MSHIIDVYKCSKFYCILYYHLLIYLCFLGIPMAQCWLTGSLVLSDKDYVDKRIQFYEKLIKLDPTRKGQYKQYLKSAEEKTTKVED